MLLLIYTKSYSCSSTLLSQNKTHLQIITWTYSNRPSSFRVSIIFPLIRTAIISPFNWAHLCFCNNYGYKTTQALPETYTNCFYCQDFT